LKTLEQREVDQIRLNTLTSLLIMRVKTGLMENKVFHLRFPENRTTRYVQRDGNAPADVDRHPWERRLRLELDLGEISNELRNAVTGLLELNKGKKVNIEDMKEIRMHLVNKVAREIKSIMGAEFQGEVPTAEDVKAVEQYEEMLDRKYTESKIQKASSTITSVRRLPGFLHHDRTKYTQ